MTEAVQVANANAPEQVMYTVPQVAKMLGRGANTVRRWLSTGAFPNAERYRGSITKIPEGDVTALRAAMKPKILRRQRAA